ncbi:MAG: hypothetical protein M3R04_06075 [bacterium]|nr:hypothetical protein [bacterium]
MKATVVLRLEAQFAGLEDLVALLPEAALIEKLGPRSNTIGEQLWCVVGARESYAHAITEGGWAGFSCSMTHADTSNKQCALEALRRAALLTAHALSEPDWTPARDELLLQLLEHEAQHQGQLIRFVYALGHTFPDSWKKRWALRD